MANDAKPQAMSSDEMLAMIARLQRERDEAIQAAKTAKTANAGTLSFKIGEKKGVSVLGLQKFPVTLYAEQWDRLIAKIPDLQKFITDHKSELSYKA